MTKNLISVFLVFVLTISTIFGNTVFGAVSPQQKPNYIAKCQINSELVTYSKCMKDLAGIPATKEEYCQPSKGALTDQECTDSYNEYLKSKKTNPKAIPFKFEIDNYCNSANPINSKDKTNCKTQAYKKIDDSLCKKYSKVPTGDYTKMTNANKIKYAKSFNNNEQCQLLLAKNSGKTYLIKKLPSATTPPVSPSKPTTTATLSPQNGTVLPAAGNSTDKNGNCGPENTSKLSPSNIRTLCDVCKAVTNTTVDKSKTNYKRCGNYAKTSEAWFKAAKVKNERQADNIKKSIAYRDGFCTYVVKSSKGSTGYVKFSAPDLKVFESNCKKITL